MSDLKKERKRKSLETVLPVTRKVKSARISMPAKTMVPIKEEETDKKVQKSNVTLRHPLRRHSLFVAPPIAEEDEETPEESEGTEKMPETKKTDYGRPETVESVEVTKKIDEDKPKKIGKRYTMIGISKK